MEKSIKPRLVWVDIAKAIAIIMMVIGHEVAFGGRIRNFIFSFHMPLFFILTGYTMKKVNTWEQLVKQVKKDILRILVPCVVVQILNWVLNFIFFGGNLGEIVRKLIQQLVWASAVDVGEYPALGALWFLVVLFWAKLGIAIIDLVFKNSNKLIVCLFLSFSSIIISSYHWLPQSLDVALMAVLFLYTGRIIKEHYDMIEKYASYIMSIAFVIWMWCWQNNLYVEMGTRSYPAYPLCVIEAICGCLCVIYLSVCFEKIWISKAIIAPIGKSSLIILCIHHLDWYFSGIWNTYGTFIRCVLRVGFDLAVVFTLLGLKYGMSKIVSKRKINVYNIKINAKLPK